MSMKKLVSAVILSISACSAFAQVDTQNIKQGVESFIGTSGVVETVTRTPYGNLYEIVLKNGELVYTDEKVSFLIDGRIIDTQTRVDITQARLKQMSTIDFSTLPLNQAIKQVRGSGKRVLVTFEDPNCGYCKRLAKELKKLPDVTIYTFLYPILGEDSVVKSRALACAADSTKAWLDWMQDGKAPPSAPAQCDSSVIERNIALGRQLRISGVPVIFLADGTRMGGYVPAAELEKALSNVK